MVRYGDLPPAAKLRVRLSFRDFLKKKGIERVFFANSCNYLVDLGLTNNRPVRSLIQLDEQWRQLELAPYRDGIQYIRQIINDAFAWANTEHGNAYWHELHNEWARICIQAGIE